MESPRWLAGLARGFAAQASRRLNRANVKSSFPPLFRTTAHLVGSGSGLSCSAERARRSPARSTGPSVNIPNVDARGGFLGYPPLLERCAAAHILHDRPSASLLRRTKFVCLLTWTIMADWPPEDVVRCHTVSGPRQAHGQAQRLEPRKLQWKPTSHAAGWGL